MNIGSLCKRDIVAIDQGTNLHQAAQLMREEHVGALVVTGNGAEGTRVLGVVTDRDLTIEVLARGRDSGRATVGALLSGRLATIPFDASLSDAVAAMDAAGVRRLLVTGPQQQLVGLVSLDDLIEAWASDMARLAQSLRKAREREARAVLPPGLTMQGMPLAVPEEPMLQAWRPTS